MLSRVPELAEHWFDDTKPPDLVVFESPVAMMIGRGGTNAEQQ